MAACSPVTEIPAEDRGQTRGNLGTEVQADPESWAGAGDLNIGARSQVQDTITHG